MISEAMQKCFQNGIRVYPIIKDWKQYIKVEFRKRKPIIYDKPVSGKKLNEALEVSYLHWADKC